MESLRRAGFPLLACAALFLSVAQAEDTLRLATYNLLNYPGPDAAQRNPRFRTVLRAMRPDVLIVQEMTSSAGVTQFRDEVLNAVEPEAFLSVPFDDGPDTDNAMLYRSSRVVFLGATYLPTALRRIAEYRFKPAGGGDTVRLYSLHLKGNQEDSLVRLAEATILRNHLNALPPGSFFVVGGDFNIYRSTEPAFLKLTGSESDNDGRSKDPLSAVGTWHANYAFRGIHTQSPRVRDFGNGTTGGLDDRFDMLLVSYPMAARIVLPSYTALGNDGNHFNDSINQPPNTAVPDSVADGLHDASDHLPLFADFIIATSGADTGFTSLASGPWSAPSTWSGGIVPAPSSAVTVAAGTTVTIDLAAVCRTLTIAGTLQFDATGGRTLTCASDMTIDAGAALRPSAPFTTGSTTQIVILGGSFTNNGVFTARSTGGSSGVRVVDVRFVGSVPSIIAGSTNPTTFNTLRMELAGTAVTLTPLVGITFSTGAANALALVRGTWVQSAGQMATPSITVNVESSAVLSVSDGGALTTGTASLLVHGVLDVSGGVLAVGAGNNRLEVLPGGVASFSGGSTTINGRMALSGGRTTITGGAITVNPRGLFDLDPAANVVEAGADAALDVSGGTITILHPRVLTSTGRELLLVPGPGVKEISGGTLALGDGISAVAGSDTGFVIESGIELASVILRTGNTAGRDVSLASSLAAGRLELASGRLRLGSPFTAGASLSVYRSLVRGAGGLDADGSVVTIGPSPGAGIDSITGGFTGANRFSVLHLSNPGGVVISGDIALADSLIITTGSVSSGESVVTLDSTARIVENGSNPVKGVIATVRRVVSGVAEDFGGIGLSLIADGASPGLTAVRRLTGHPVISGFAQSIGRSFDITPALNSGLDTRMQFSYADSDLGGQEAGTLHLYRSSGNGGTWEWRGGDVDTLSRTVTLDSIGSFSRWTAADAFNPLNQVMISIPMADGWNMVSNPVRTPLDSVVLLFPACGRRSAYRFDAAWGYIQEQHMAEGTGYWIRCLEGTASITGLERVQDSVHLVPGWNMIGALSVILDTALVVEIPEGLVTSSYFHYSTGLYLPVDSLRPGEAYWVKAATEGVLILGTPAAGVGQSNVRERW